MENFLRLTQAQLIKYTRHRSGEIKFGERMHTVPPTATIIDYIKQCEAQYVLFGVPEDIGIRANYGRPGAAGGWEAAIKAIANMQHNRFCKGSNILALGQIDVSAGMQQAQDLAAEEKDERKLLFGLTEKTDKDVSHLVCQILLAGKTPIIIGGGHNNSYGNIKGAALAKGRPVNALNFDAHTDFRILDGRHSGNGAGYAFQEGFLKNYFIFGLHEGYASKAVLENIKKNADRIQYNTYEQIAVRKEKHFSEQLVLALNFIGNTPFGLEVDLDAILLTSVSAITPSGFNVEKARQLVNHFGKSPNAAYLHISEGAPDPESVRSEELTGKLIAFLITDFIKAHSAALP